MYKNADSAKGHGVTAVLGPTNTGKTHMAIERMVAHDSGVIGLPLRLLAREVYGRVCDKVGVGKVSLITGEERITPAGSKFQICTVEAMPETTDVDFVAIDEVQLATDFERGHFFTDRILNLRGRYETMLLGADTMAGALKELLPGLNIVTRPRMSVLAYSGSKKITRMPSRTAIVAFSADEVYAIAELVRRERGGTAVVTGSLSPRTRNAQVALYQSGDVDFLIATDAIGMGLNLDVNHVAFAQDSKFDGFQHRRLTAAEFAQVAGRAGRYKKDGTFGITSRVQPFSDELVEALETHVFEPAKILTWRNRDLDFSSVSNLQKSLEQPAGHPRLMRAPAGTDVTALEMLVRDPEIYDLMGDTERVKLLWEVAKTPDYRKISPTSHAELLSEVFVGLAKDGFVREDWFADLVSRADNTSGEIDALSARIANVRTCTYISNRDNWLENPTEWREKSREVEDRLSDALHDTLTKRFIDRRTSILMKRLKENRMLEAEIEQDGTVKVEGHVVGALQGFRFSPDSSSGSKDTKALNAAATKVLASEIEKRADRLAASPNSDIVVSNDATLRWIGQPVAKLARGENALKPRIFLLADEQLTGTHLEKVVARLERWVSNHINTLLKPLADLQSNTELNGIARGIAYQLAENLGTIQRKDIAEDLKNLDQDMRGIMRRIGVRFGAYHVFVPLMLKPAPTQLICLLWAVHNDAMEASGLVEIPEFSAAGRTSFPVDPIMKDAFYTLSGFRVLGEKAVRIDILERLADLIRPITNWKEGHGQDKPDGAIDGRSFYVTPAMMSILGATHEDMEVILKGLGYRSESRLESEVKPQKVATEKPMVTGESALVAEDSPAGEIVAGTSEVSTDAAVQVVAAEPEKDEVAASEKVEVAADPEKDEVAAPEKDEAEAPEKDEAEAPKRILIWRYGGSGERRRTNAHRHHQKKNATRHRNSKDARPKGNRTNDQKKAAKPDRIDPDSPFAALAALKSTMQSDND
ncbi:MAG: helicase-related protein [Pseudomonadota bacterium]